MKKLISTKTHGILDYLTAPTLLLLPRTLGLSKKVTTLLTGAALGILGYSVITRYELGLFKILPMKGHLTIDMINGAMLAVAPFVLFDEAERNPTLIALLLSLGAFEITTASLTQMQPSPGTEDLMISDTLTAGLDTVKKAIGIGQ